MKFHQTLREELSLNPVKLCRKNINRLIFAQLNINSLRNNFESLQHIINKNIIVLLISQTKIDSSFPSAQFHLEGYADPYGLDRM